MMHRRAEVTLLDDGELEEKDTRMELPKEEKLLKET